MTKTSKNHRRRIKKLVGGKRKTKNAKRLCKYNKRGGRVVKLSQEYVEKWMPLQCKQDMDCGPNTFTFLGYVGKELGEFIGRLTTFGLDPNIILQELNIGYGETHKPVQCFMRNDDGNILYDANMVNKVLLENGMAVILALFRNNGGHFAVLWRNYEGIVEILDPQAALRSPNSQPTPMVENIDGTTIGVLSPESYMYYYLEQGQYTEGYIFLQEQFYNEATMVKMNVENEDPVF